MSVDERRCYLTIGLMIAACLAILLIMGLFIAVSPEHL